MTAIETIIFPDAVAVCCLYGQAALVAGGDSTTVVNSRVTNDERQVTLELTDSEIHSLVVQRSTIKVEVRTGIGPLAQEEAQDLGQLFRGLLGAMEGTVQAGATIYKVADGAGGFADSPDDKNGNARYTFWFSISMRGGATLDQSTVVAIPDWLRTGVLSVEAGTNVTVDDTDPQHPVVSSTSSGGAPTGADYLTGTAQSGLSNEIVVGTSPQGELGGSWASPTVDAVHSGSSHAATRAAAEATAAAALAAHEADTTAVHGIADTSLLETAAGAQAKVDTHVNDTSDAHDASAISILDTAGDFTATDVEGALAELQSAIEAGGSSTGMTRDIVQVAHGLAVGNPIRYNGTAYVKAKADSATNAEVVGLVSVVADADHFTVQLGGNVTGLSGLTAGEVYFLSEATAGTLTVTQPSSVGQVSKPLLIADSTTSGYFFNFRGAVVTAAPTSLLEVTVSLSAAQIRALDVTPVQIVAAPGANKVLFPVLMILSLTVGAQPFQFVTGVGTNDQRPFMYFPGDPTQISMMGLLPAGLMDALVDMVGMENTGGNHNFTRAVAANQPLRLTITGSLAAGPIAAHAKNAGGSGYVTGDTGVIDGGDDAAYVVDTVTAGAVTTYHLTANGSSYVPAVGATTTPGLGQPGIGTGFTIDINSVTPGDGTATVTVRYAVVNV